MVGEPSGPTASTGRCRGAYLAALIEKRSAGGARGARGDPATSIVIPARLIAGTKTVVPYSLMLALPAWQPSWMWLMAGLVGVTIVQRLAGAWSRPP